MGYTAVDELLYVDAYPQADAKMPVRRRERQCGGLAATALVAAARLGCRCAYAGTLGDDDHSQFVIQRFGEEGIDVTHVRRRPDARPVRSTIIVDQSRQTRTILFDLDGVVGVDSSWPPEDVIRAARVLLVDNCGVEGMIRAARIARDARIPVVADFENAEDPLFPQLLALVDHLILSRDFALKVTGEQDPASAAHVALGARPAGGGRHLRQRGLLVRKRPTAGDSASPAGIGRRGGRHDRLRRRVSRRLRGGVGPRAGRSGRRAVCHGGRRSEGDAPRRSGGHPDRSDRRGTDGDKGFVITFAAVTACELEQDDVVCNEWPDPTPATRRELV